VSYDFSIFYLRRELVGNGQLARNLPISVKLTPIAAAHDATTKSEISSPVFRFWLVLNSICLACRLGFVTHRLRNFHVGRNHQVDASL